MRTSNNTINYGQPYVFGISCRLCKIKKNQNVFLNKALLTELTVEDLDVVLVTITVILCVNKSESHVHNIIVVRSCKEPAAVGVAVMETSECVQTTQCLQSGWTSCSQYSVRRNSVKLFSMRGNLMKPDCSSDLIPS